MPVHLAAPLPADIHGVPGVRIGVAEAGIRKVGRKDLTVFLLDEGTAVAGVFTRNRFCAAPVQVCREHLASAASVKGVRAIVINTGNANAGTGQDGLARARATSAAAAGLLGLQPAQVLPFSTGVIMEPLPVDRIEAGLPAAIGAQFAHPDKLVIDMAGDGSIQMNIQELATIVQNKLPIKVIILNNCNLGMVRQWQELFYNQNYESTCMEAQPDFVKLAEAYGAEGYRIVKEADLMPMLRTALASPNPAIIDVRVAKEENVYPMVPSGAALDEMLLV